MPVKRQSQCELKAMYIAVNGDKKGLKMKISKGAANYGNAYFKQKGSLIYHWHRGCAKVPPNVYHNSNWAVLRSEPTIGKACEVCKKLG